MVDGKLYFWKFMLKTYEKGFIAILIRFALLQVGFNWFKLPEVSWQLTKTYRVFFNTNIVEGALNLAFNKFSLEVLLIVLTKV